MTRHPQLSQANLISDQTPKLDSDDPASWLVAHRGWPDRFPENSLEGIQAVLDAGARYVEFDVQITADRYAVVIHDDDLRRLTGQGGRVTQKTLAELQTHPSGVGIHRPAQVPELGPMLALIGTYPGVTAFVELKRQSIDRHGARASVQLVLEAIDRASCPVVFLSFRWRAVRLARRLGQVPVGWAFRPWSFLAFWQAKWLQPDYLFVRADRIPRRARPFWAGPWHWVIYGVGSLVQARRLRARGAVLIEVDDLPGMLGNREPSDQRSTSANE